MKRKLSRNGQKVDRNKLIKLKNWEKSLIDDIVYAYNSQINMINEYYSNIPSNHKNQLIKKISRMVIYDEIKDDKIRIGLIKLLISLMPESFNLIKKILELKRNKYDYELHFTIFCYLDDVTYKETKESLDQLTRVIVDYMKNIRIETAKAAWMAGHLLGDHWPAKKALPALIEIIQDSKNRVGREAAISGLGELYKKVNTIEKKKIVDLLQYLVVNDRSKEVRLLSGVIINLKNN